MGLWWEVRGSEAGSDNSVSQLFFSNLSTQQLRRDGRIGKGGRRSNMKRVFLKAVKGYDKKISFVITLRG